MSQRNPSFKSKNVIEEASIPKVKSNDEYSRPSTTLNDMRFSYNGNTGGSLLFNDLTKNSSHITESALLIPKRIPL